MELQIQDLKPFLALSCAIDLTCLYEIKELEVVSSPRRFDRCHSSNLPCSDPITNQSASWSHGCQLCDALSARASHWQRNLPGASCLTNLLILPLLVLIGVSSNTTDPATHIHFETLLLFQGLLHKRPSLVPGWSTTLSSLFSLVRNNCLFGTPLHGYLLSTHRHPVPLPRVIARITLEPRQYVFLFPFHLLVLLRTECWFSSY